MPPNIEFPIIVFFETTDSDSLCYFPIQKMGVNTNLSDQVFKALPVVLTSPVGGNQRLSPTATFRGFWLGENSWADPYQQVTTKVANHLLVAVEEALADQGIEYFSFLAGVLSKELIERDSESSEPPPAQLLDQTGGTRMTIEQNAQIRHTIFISYSHKDKKWLERLQTMLRPLVREELIKIWADKGITENCP